MPAETKYIARRSGPFAALMQATELAGLRLEVLPPVSLRDAYFDTVAGDLLRQGYVLRVREQGRLASAQLRALRHDATGTPGDADAALEPPLTGPTLPLLPEGPLRDAVDWLAGEAPLRALLRLRQYRSARVAYEGSRLVGVLSLDVVGYELPAGLHVANEVEVELAETGSEDDLNRLDPVLRARGLEPTSRSKFERGVLRLQRGPEDPLLLLPDERAALDALMETPDPAIRRRARVILLASRGYRDETVSAKAGLSPSRVRHWVQRFREGRLDALGVPETPLEALSSGEASDREATSGSARRPAFRISEVVSGGTPTPALFRPEHFSPDGPTGPPEEPEDGLTIEREREESPTPTFTPRGDGATAGQPTEPFAVVRSAPAPETPPAPAPVTPEPVAPDAAFGEGGPPPAPFSVGSWEVVEVTAPEAADMAAPEADDPRTQGLPDSVETLDDLLGLIETGSVHTPRLGAPEAPPAVGSGDEGPPATPSSFVWLDTPDGE
ncbi:MAG TPA: helix-turn-helix domain-containing protein, partial [Rhodothermales bacterium]|nr:helix-turn-helix domain-containing protein [Rhodothermales bacterium]